MKEFNGWAKTGSPKVVGKSGNRMIKIYKQSGNREFYLNFEVTLRERSSGIIVEFSVFVTAYNGLGSFEKTLHIKPKQSPKTEIKKLFDEIRFKIETTIEKDLKTKMAEVDALTGLKKHLSKGLN